MGIVKDKFRYTFSVSNPNTEEEQYYCDFETQLLDRLTVEPRNEEAVRISPLAITGGETKNLVVDSEDIAFRIRGKIRSAYTGDTSEWSQWVNARYMLFDGLTTEGHTGWSDAQGATNIWTISATNNTEYNFLITKANILSSNLNFWGITSLTEVRNCLVDTTGKGVYILRGRTVTIFSKDFTGQSQPSDNTYIINVNFKWGDKYDSNPPTGEKQGNSAYNRTTQHSILG